MENFLPLFTQWILLLCLPPVLFGLALYVCGRVFAYLAGNGSGKPFLLAANVLSTPLREGAHALAAVLFLHRVESMRLFEANGENGEFGYVEHSYNPRNPIAVFGNFVYAMAPVAMGLFAVFVIFLSCFHGVLLPFIREVRTLGENGAEFSAYVRAALSLIPALIGAPGVSVFAKIVGALLLFFIAFGVSVSFAELSDALYGFLMFTGIAALVSLALSLFDSRLARALRVSLTTFSTTVVALFLPVCLAGAVWLFFGAILFFFRKIVKKEA